MKALITYIDGRFGKEELEFKSHPNIEAKEDYIQLTEIIDGKITSVIYNMRGVLKIEFKD